MLSSWHLPLDERQRSVDIGVLDGDERLIPIDERMPQRRSWGSALSTAIPSGQLKAVPESL
jgi:hypothetical protein